MIFSQRVTDQHRQSLTLFIKDQGQGSLNRSELIRRDLAGPDTLLPSDSCLQSLSVSFFETNQNYLGRQHSILNSAALPEEPHTIIRDEMGQVPAG